MKVIHPEMHGSSYMRRPCKGHGVGCMWLLLLLNRHTGGDKLVIAVKFMVMVCGQMISHVHGWPVDVCLIC